MKAEVIGHPGRKHRTGTDDGGDQSLPNEGMKKTRQGEDGILGCLPVGCKFCSRAFC